MKNRLAPLAFGLLLALPLCTSQAATAAGSRNERLARDYYSRLIATPTPQTAELTLFANLLPKGGDLHNHYSGAQYAETYLAWIDQQHYCINPQSSQIQTTSPTGPDCVSAADLVNNENAYRTLLQRWSDKDFSNHTQLQPPPDQQFFDTFGYFGAISGYDTPAGLRLLKERAKAENVQYLETMLQSAPATINPQLAPAIDALSPDATRAQFNAAIVPYADFLANDPGAQKSIADYRERLAGYAKGIDEADFTLRFQTYVGRTSAASKVFAGLFAAFAAAQNNPLIVGVNIVAPENNTVSMRDYALHMRMFQYLRQRFPGVHISTHAGELALGMVPPEGLRNHIRQAVEIAGAERIGHGVDIAHEDNADQLLAELATKNIAIEVNLTSNAFILGVANDAHPVTLYARQGVPFVLSTDDPGVSRNNLSGEYLLYITRYKPSYEALKRVVYNSIRYAFLTPEEKQQQLRKLDERFASFEARMAKLAKPIQTR
ncbi:adenosine deaminase family protein [Uliginosibacterium gangwonense]|uniref:adenosine deaminase family protein n=1 Tax=Uliginosibacterium gangwonense TaxID=392736 RepID=UPI00037E8701|nr:hypothetical protein [Uliginosibacterium gangwonense]